eukprot:TRINITY_DN2448_c0_g1_i2.p2 TRINITY_DN2448_c0_g1~~TRINITY_DN2448_c0_g1_i2.p2  ORF type:complete len:124 (+),score=32.12 TRINITY_DN2448_c0_g1_i2:70-441(+)
MSVVGSATWLANALKRLPDAIKVTKVNNRWQKPEFSALKLARIRKAGGGDAVDAALAEVRPRAAPRDPKPPKGRKADRLKPERMAKVERLLTRQPELIAKMKETRKTQAAEKAKKKAMGNPTI